MKKGGVEGKEWASESAVASRGGGIMLERGWVESVGYHSLYSLKTMRTSIPRSKFQFYTALTPSAGFSISPIP